MTVAQLKSSMDIDELAHWMAYDQIDPIGGYRQDINFAMLANVSAKIAGVEDTKLSDYLVFDPDPVDEDERERREQAEQIAKWQAQTLEMQQYFEHLKVKKPLPSQWLLFML